MSLMASSRVSRAMSSSFIDMLLFQVVKMARAITALASSLFSIRIFLTVVEGNPRFSPNF